MSKRTTLYQAHLDAGAKMVDFAGWSMPIHYGSQLNEHHAVRKRAGMFDVSHMTIIDVKGPDSQAFLRYLFANDVAKLKQAGKALYTCMLNQEGHVLDDLIVYYLGETHYRIVFNAGTHDKVLAYLAEKSKAFNIEYCERLEHSIIAVQGPEARKLLSEIFPKRIAESILTLKPFTAISIDNMFIARTGYTGEDGVEMMVPNLEIENLWHKLLFEKNIPACGLGARDTLRLEAGYNLYGTDMDETVSPLVSNLTWTIAWEPSDREFVGRKALEEEKQNLAQQLVGIKLLDKGVLRNGLVVHTNQGKGVVTSGSYSPIRECGIALARLPKDCDKAVQVDVRGRLLNALIVDLPFINKEKK